MSSAFTSSRISIDQPWYNFFATAFGLPLLFLLAFAPYVAWRGTSIKVVAKKIRIPLLVTVASAIALAVFGAGSSPTGLAAVCLGILVIVGVFIDLIKIRSRRRIGAWIAHAGLALLVIGIAGGAWSTRVEHEFKPGDSIKVGSYVVTFKNTTRERTKSTMRTRAIFEIKNGDRSLGEMKAGRDFHPVSGEASNEVAIRHDWLRAQDLFITVDRLTENNTAQVVVLINQLMPMVWLGGLLIIIGGVVVAVPLKASTRKPSVSKNATSDTDAVRTRVYG